MTSPAQFVPSGRLEAYEPIHMLSMWGEFKENGFSYTKLNNQSEDSSHETPGPPNKFDQEATRPDKIRRRLAQNREAARKCRLRKKAYVQDLETSKIRLIQLEQELERARQQGAYSSGGVLAAHVGYSGAIKTGIAAFETRYSRWVDEQNKQVRTLRTVLNSHDVTDMEFCQLVNNCMTHYSELFQIKATAAKADIFYLMSGVWRTSAERFFLWIGGFRPSELLQVLQPQLSLDSAQASEVQNLSRSCQQAEEALSQGMDRLRQILRDGLITSQVLEGGYMPQPASVTEKLEALVGFANQADFIRQETLQQMSRILNPRQTVQGFLALGEYFQRLRALSSSWATHPREPT